MMVCSLHSPLTPPGTKIRITGKISVVNGFITLKRSSTEVLGGSVEALLAKWNLHLVSCNYSVTGCGGMH